MIDNIRSTLLTIRILGIYGVVITCKLERVQMKNVVDALSTHILYSTSYPTFEFYDPKKKNPQRFH